MIKQVLIFGKNVFLNILNNHKNDIFHVVEGVDWAVFQVGKNICRNNNTTKTKKIKLTTTHIGLRNKIIHFGSVNTLISKNGVKSVHPSNKIVLTWFHIPSDDKRIKYIPELNKKIDVVHTSCNITKEKLINHGLSADKIVVVPLGVDLEKFKPYSEEKKIFLKKKLGIPENKLVIGSFQKDGNGWGEGFEPKMIKGPDVFCDAVEKLSKIYPVHVLLTGPARGFVKRKLEMSGIGYTHKYLKNYPVIANFYNVLDLYLVTSREEGGPLAILESMACGIPVISTPVGMAPEVLLDNLDFLLTTQGDVAMICEKAEKLLKDKELRNKIVQNELERVKKYNWETIAGRYYKEIYSKIAL
ncbi:MAG: glycosyltransferase family 4 protein [Candidatus Moranbacteria bacterium]|nr:glycosyltransferase family 4 protein [Candidatus Moranbacteria bacterium]